MRSRSVIAISASALLVTSTALATASMSSAAPQRTTAPTASTTVQSGSFALSGQEARAYRVPDDVRQSFTVALPGGRTQTRYQQVVAGATVFGGQVTVIKSSAGVTESVIGAYFPGLTPANTTKLTKQGARSSVEKKIGARGTWSTELRIDPRNRQLFYQVQSIRDVHRPIRWINAGTGATVKAFDAIAHGEGTGVKGDTKTVLTTRDAASGLYKLESPDGRQITYSANNTTTTASLMTDADDRWVTNNTKMTGSSQAPGVDAQYYANVVDDFYRDVFARDSIDGKGMQIKSYAHFDRNYCNASWNGAYMVYGDGDGRGCLPLSGGLDVDGHELTHGVTDFTSDLIYENESGALNEGFSDMMGNTIEYYADAHQLDPTVKPDFRIGEDVINASTPATAGFRNMGDPAEFGDPDHVVDEYTGAEDSGGVHTNSGIANHAYFLTVNGGHNRGCAATATRAATHTEDCAVDVPAIGLDRAAQIYYAGFTSLNEYANFCDARNATVAAAGDDAAAVSSGWEAVGVHDGCAGGLPPAPPCVSQPDAQLPFASPHPYGNMGDCTWTYDNGSPGFAFHFTLMDTEKDYDYVYVKDADGNTLATYTGTKHGKGFYGPCIPTSTGSVQLVTDPAVTGQGFTVDAVKDC